MITLNQFLTYCKRNNIACVAITVYSPFDECDFDLLSSKPGCNVSTAVGSTTYYMTPSEAYVSASKPGRYQMLRSLHYDVLEAMRKHCPRPAVFANHKSSLIDLFDDDLPF